MNTIFLQCLGAWMHTTARLAEGEKSIKQRCTRPGSLAGRKVKRVRRELGCSNEVGQGHGPPGLQCPEDGLIGKEAAASLQHDSPAGQLAPKRSQQDVVVCTAALAEPALVRQVQKACLLEQLR